MQQTLVVLKPDAVARRLVGRILCRLEDKGLLLRAMRLVAVDEPLARQMYSVHEGKEFYEPLVEFITAGPVVAMVWQGPDAIAIVRSLMGPTFGPDAPGGTVRGDFGSSRRYNLIHGSDSPVSAEREIPLFFSPADFCAPAEPGRDWILASIDTQPPTA